MHINTPPSIVSEGLLEGLQGLLGLDNVRVGEKIARYTTWRVGGPAALLVVARDVDGLARSVALLRAAGVPWLVLGRGSNVLCNDAGIDAAVVVNRADGLWIEDVTVRAESGVSLAVLARRTVAAGLTGLEWCHDIPGSVGGAVVNNAGAHGGEMAGVLRRVRVLDAAGDVRELAAHELGFGYRRSILREEAVAPSLCPRGHADTGTAPGEEKRPPSRGHARLVVLDAVFEAQRVEAAEARRKMAAQRERRKATQPGGASAGSVFKNPRGDSAGRLVESLGLKGARVGDAAISTLHANFIVGGPHATASDVLDLIALARRRVRDAYDVLLEPEVQYVYHDGSIGAPPLEEE